MKAVAVLAGIVVAACVAAMVEHHCEIPRLMAARLAAGPGVRVLNDVVLNQVIVRFGSGLDTEAVIAVVQRRGECFVGGARWRDQSVKRISVIGWATGGDDPRRSAAHREMCASRRAARQSRTGITIAGGNQRRHHAFRRDTSSQPDCRAPPAQIVAPQLGKSIERVVKRAPAKSTSRSASEKRRAAHQE